MKRGKIMTFGRLIELAQFGSAMDKYSTNVEYIDIHDFGKMWCKLVHVELDDITLIDNYRDDCLCSEETQKEYRK